MRQKLCSKNDIQSKSSGVGIEKFVNSSILQCLKFG